MKNISIPLLSLIFLCLVLAFLLRPDLINGKAVIIDVEYDQHRGKNLETDFESIDGTRSVILPAAKNPDWQEQVEYFGFTAEQVTHQETLNAQAQTNPHNQLIKAATDAFISDLTSGFDPSTGEKNQLTSTDIRTILTNIDRQIASVKQLKNHMLSQSQDNIPGRQLFEKEYDSSITRLIHLRQSILNSSYLLNQPEYQP